MWSSLLSMFGQGLLHGLGPDHCLAIGTLAAAGGGLRRALGVSVRFGLGHTAVLAAGAVLAGVAGVAIPARWEAALEVVGGLSLLALGCWTLLSRTGAVPHAHGGVVHAHDGRSHSHDGVETEVTPPTGGRFAALMGAVFGLSGIRALLMLVPLMGRERAVMLSAGVALFGLGVVLSMTAVGWVAQRVTDAAARWERGLRVPVGVASVVCGAWWVVSHV
jgi:nickel/cobalt exporter